MNSSILKLNSLKESIQNHILFVVSILMTFKQYCTQLTYKNSILI